MAKELLRGNPETCCEEIPKFLYLLRYANPGTITKLVRKKLHVKGNRNNVRIHLKYLFMALGQCIHGYRSSICPVVTVDGTFLKSSYRGTLLVANCQDGNYQIYPLAFAIVDFENNASWTWFFKHLKEITGDNEDLVILSDSAADIKHGFNKVFQHAHHGFFTFHLYKNLRSKFPKSDVENLFMAAKKAYTVPEFENCSNALCSKNEEIRQYLLEKYWPYWSRALFEGLRYNMTTTNNAESFNARIVNAREFSFLGLLKFIRELLQEWFYERRESSSQLGTFITPMLEEELNKRYNELHVFPVVKHINENEYEVRVGELVYIADL